MREELIKSYETALKATPRLRDVFTCLSKKMALAGGDVLAGLLRYDTGIGSYDNAIYDDVRVRAALYLKYFVAGSYHIERQNVLTKFLGRCGKISSVVDIGYGAPGLYVRDIVLRDEDMHLSLLDKFDRAATFSRTLIGCAYPDTNWERQIDFKTFDLDDNKSPGKFDAYILFDSIEHAQDPSKSMDAIVMGAPDHAQFLLSIPICPKEGLGAVHFIEWLTEDAAKSWLAERQLKVEDQETVTPTKADLWSEGIDFHDLIVRCTKA